MHSVSLMLELGTPVLSFLTYILYSVVKMVLYFMINNFVEVLVSKLIQPLYLSENKISTSQKEIN